MGASVVGIGISEFNVARCETLPLVMQQRAPARSDRVRRLVFDNPAQRATTHTSAKMIFTTKSVLKPIPPHNGGIDDQVFEIRIFVQLCEKPLPAALFCPSPETFHLPNSSGRSRHGAPARTNHNTASTSKRWSSPCRPLSPSFSGTSGSIRCHCPSSTPAESRSPSPVAILNHIRESMGSSLVSTGPSVPTSRANFSMIWLASISFSVMRWIR